MFHRPQFLLVVCVLVACFARDCPAAQQESGEHAELRRELDRLRILASGLQKRIDALEARIDEAERGGGQAGKSTPSPKPSVDRVSRLGLDGYCPVTLVNEMRWLLGKPQHRDSYEGCVYLFAGQEQKQEFQEQPERFAPVLSGYDAVLWFDEAKLVIGERKHGFFCSGSIWLFSSEECLQRFERDPNRYLLAKAISAADRIDAAADLCPRERVQDPGPVSDAPDTHTGDAGNESRPSSTRRRCAARRGIRRAHASNRRYASDR